MDPLIYTLMTGATHTLKAMQVRAHNMANAQTDGFRADLEYAEGQRIEGYGFDARHQVRTQANAVSARAGASVATGRALDVALEGDGFLAVASPTGEPAHTRAGALQIDDQGALTLNGMSVLGDGGPIVLPEFEAIEIGADGTISIRGPGEAQMEIADKLMLVSAPASQLTKNEAGLLISRDGAPLAADEDVRIKGGHLERSNVSPVEEMLNTMALSRDFEMQMRMYKSVDELADAGNRLIRG